MSETVHNWRVTRETKTDTHEVCEGHCLATCWRDKETRLIVNFDATGQERAAGERED